MSNGLTDISASNSLDFYLDPKNIAPQDLVRETISHIENIRKNIFNPLEFLNLLTKQFSIAVEKSETPLIRFEKLKLLLLTPEQKHILYFFIIKWHGGVGSLFPDEGYILRLIENEFKKYKENTPEKDLYFSEIPKIYRLTFDQMESLKLDFDKLTYPGKLRFWDENIKDDIDIYTISSIGFYRENEIKELGIVADSSISIYPNDKVELEQHNRWLFNHIQWDKALRHCHFESLKESYFETINNNPRAIEYTEQEIYAIKERRDKEKKYSDEKRNISLWGYYLGYQSVVKKENFYLELAADKFKRIGVSYAKGIAAAHYLSFLEIQLDKLRRGENILGQKNESLRDRNAAAFINGKKFYNVDDFKLIISELLKLDPLLSFHVTDFLEFHYSQAAFTTRWSRVNWFTMLRKTLFMCGYKDDKDSIENLPTQIRHAFSWEMHKSLELINVKTKFVKNNMPHKDGHQIPLGVFEIFDYSNKENYFFTDKIDIFKQVENELILKEYIDAKGSWNKEKKYLVALIHIMYSLKYMRPKINGKSEKNTKLEYRRFFETRYKTDLTQEMKPSKFPPNKVKDYKFDFHFVPEIEKV